VSVLQQPRVRIGIGVLALAMLGAGIWYWATAGRETTDDAQVDAQPDYRVRERLRRDTPEFKRRSRAARKGWRTRRRRK